MILFQNGKQLWRQSGFWTIEIIKTILRKNNTTLYNTTVKTKNPRLSVNEGFMFANLLLYRNIS
jgi:hypothetical protein